MAARKKFRRQVSQPKHRLVHETLEDRRLLAGLTIVTHGFQVGDTPNAIGDWVNDMAMDIATEVTINSITTPIPPATGVAQYEMVIERDGIGPIVTDWKFAPGFTQPHVTNAPFDAQNFWNSIDGEAVVVLNWSSVAALNGIFPEANTDNLASVVSDYFLNSLGQLGMDLLSVPIHLVGHSRGASLNAALAKEFGEEGILVDQYTSLDAHPITFDYGEFGGITLTDNVVFGDSYYRQGPGFNGEAIFGAYNRMLDEGVLGNSLYGYGENGGHSDVHLWYDGTILTD